MDPHQRRRQKSPSPLVIMLLIELYKQFERLPVKPPVTIGLIGLNLFVHLHPEPYIFGMYLDDIHRNCIHPYKIIRAFQYDREILWNRLFLSSIIHTNDMHLYYNMLSLAWKGINLENEVGSHTFLWMVVFSLVVSHCLLVLLSYCLYTYCGLNDYSSGMSTCAVGFSAVLFSLKYIWNSKASNISNVMGINVPTKYAAWLELVVTSLITPNASFLGHLAGILAGVLYVHGPIFPFSWMVQGLYDKVMLFFTNNNTTNNASNTTYYTFEDADYRAYQNQNQNQQNASSSYSFSYPSSEELRQQRLQRLNQSNTTTNNNTRSRFR